MDWQAIKTKVKQKSEIILPTGFSGITGKVKVARKKSVVADW